MAQLDLIEDVAVSGVSGGRTSNEKISRAWVVLCRAGKGTPCNDQGVERMVSSELGETEVVKRPRRVRDRHRGMHCLLFYDMDSNIHGLGSLDTKVANRKGVKRRILQDAYEERNRTGTTASKSRL